ncbi:glycosyltransferase WbuB [Rhodopirellula halodulae]|uniref:glycosyltransferase WbuB n=1 Tax=Rhodopirellula halodulae TaxID=2894198 RepID=UPI0027D2BA8F|nr:glycosyltransferase WbuB [Rhodopirellula sp. JC740]
MKILLHGLNFSPEEIGIGKYSGEMVAELAAAGHEVVVVTTPPYYPRWKIGDGYSGMAYRREELRAASYEQLDEEKLVASGDPLVEGNAVDPPSSHSQLATRNLDLASRNSRLATGRPTTVIRCPLWVPGKVTGLKRVIHLASFGLSSIPVVLWKAISFRPDVVLTVEPAAMCMPTTWIASRLCGAKCWLHVQDFEVDAAFELGILKQPILKRMVLSVEAFLMRRFDRVSSISPNMLLKLVQKGVDEKRVVSFPNWVDCDAMKPLLWPGEVSEGKGSALRTKQVATEGSVSERSARERMDALRSEFLIPAEKVVALYAGNIGSKQGLELIVEAAKNAANSSLHYVICGTGASYDCLAEACHPLTNVQMLPVQPFEKFNDLMNCADIHLLPQKAGAADLVMPSKLTGMLATGRPVVACASQGTQIADVTSGRGMVVEPDDAVAFQMAIEKLAEDPALRVTLGKAAREYAVEHLSQESILGQFMEDLADLRDESCVATERMEPVGT